MDVIPVIDVRGGVVVRAAGGARADYRPIDTPLAEGSEPLAIARALLAIGPFETLYVADLDGIEGRDPDLDLVARLSAALPAVRLWVDNGAGDEAAARALLAVPRVTPVVGSETMGGAESLRRIRECADDQLVLSLDFRGEEFLGPPRLLEDASSWPLRIIVMTLGRVGSASGPDLRRLAAIRTRAGERRVYAAGGVRHAQDLAALRAAGAAGALVASALHGGTIRAGDLG